MVQGFVPLVYACIAPHAGELLPGFGGKKHRAFARTRRGMNELAIRLRRSRPDTIVIASPHNLRLQKHLGVVVSEHSSGRVADGKKSVKLGVDCDIGFGKRTVDLADERGLPVVGANYGALEGALSDLAMDWGTLIPLWFLMKGRTRKAKVVIITPSRGIPLQQNFDFGKVVAEVAEGASKRVAFVASADQAHAHMKDGPYGFDRRAEKYDRLVAEAIRGGDLASIMRMDGALVEGAKPDSLWQMVVLAGALSVVPMEGELISYEVPTYFGVLCASYGRDMKRGAETPT